MSDGVILAIEASQRRGGVALQTGDGDVFIERFDTTNRHDDVLLPAIDRLFEQAALSPREMSAVGVSIGPGGFTGLRIAVSTAKMFAYALGAKIVPVPGAVVAAGSHAGPGPILVALASKREQAWITRLRWDGEFWSIEGQPGLIEASDLRLAGIEALVGDHHLPAAFIEACERAGVTVVEPRFEPQACLDATCGLLWADRTVDQFELRPLYPRQPEAVSIWDASR